MCGCALSAALACGSTSQHSSAGAPIAEDPPALAVDAAAAPAGKPVQYTLPSFTPPVEPNRVCAKTATKTPPKPAPAAAPQRIKKQKKRHYDFSGDTIEPVDYGPRVAERASPSFERTAASIRRGLRDLTRYISGCYRWVRFRKRRVANVAPTVHFELTVHPMGNVSGVKAWVFDKRKAAQDLGACVGKGLLAMKVPGTTARLTRVKSSIRFVRSGLDRPDKPVASPPALPVRRPAHAAACIKAPARLPVDELRIDNLARFDDWDPFHAAMQDRLRRARAAARARKRRGKGQGGRVSVRPPVLIGCSGDRGDNINKRGIRAEVRNNLGALRGCYRAARARNPSLSGTVVTTFEILPEGMPAKVRARGVDAQLERCVSAALTELRFSASDEGGTVVVRYPFHFRADKMDTTALPSEGLARARALLERGDGHRAAEAFAAVIRTSGGTVDECYGRLGVLEAMLVSAPWRDDPRVWAASLDVARYITRTSAKLALGECLTRAAALTRDVASERATWRITRTHTGNYPLASVGTVKHISELLSAWPAHPHHVRLRLIRAAELARLDRYRKAKEAYQEALQYRLSKRWVAHALEGHSHARKRADEYGGSGPLVRRTRCGP
jgi:hypothetical protein